MSSIKNLKKTVNERLSEVIEEAYVWEIVNGKSGKVEKIIDEVIETFDALVEKINAGRFSENKKKHFKAIAEELDAKVKSFMDKLK